ncbi:MAG: DUF2779 domain-containing protein [Thermodesulfobacteriota bacterium]
MARKRLLTKSKYLVGLQYSRYLWVMLNDPDRIPKPDASTQHRFDEGHLVGEWAKKLFPDGIDIPADDFKNNLRQTEELLKKRKPLFEAGFTVDNTFSRVDVLKPVSKDEWDIIEVKSSTSVKPVNIHDVSFQRYCCEKYGLKIRKCFLMYINNGYIRQSEIDPEGLLTSTDITAQVDEATHEIQKRIENMYSAVVSDKCPSVTIGEHCNSPYECPLKEECWGFLPENNVLEMYGDKKKPLKLIEKGIYSFKDIPDDFALNGKQEIQKGCEISGKAHIEKKAIKQFLNTLEYPLYYLDFETFSGAIPPFEGTRPYQQIPFQFSLHVVEKDNAIASHYSFLADGTNDPRHEFIGSLKNVLGNSGSIVVYNKSFEEGILRALANVYPEYDKWVENVNDRMIDLFAPFRSFHYYDSRQKGSASIKRVLPVLTGTSYDHLDISDGMDASLAFLDIISNNVTEKEGIKIRKDLEKYCTLDTEGMIWIVNKLKELIK